MKLGICLPYMKEGLTRADYLDWFRRVDDGPFHSLSCGERVHGPTFDMRAVLAAAAAVTNRIEIVPTLYVLPMHNAVRVAKEVATLQVLSGGRLKRMVVGYGGREKDYEAVGATFKGRYGRMDQQVADIRRVWAQEEIVEGAGPIGPALDQPPQILTGALGPKSIARGAQWADGLYGWSGNGEQAELQNAFAMADNAWSAAERPDKPYRLGGFWFTLTDEGQQTLYDYVYDYLAIAGPEIATAMASAMHRSNEAAVLEALDNAEAAGCEELMLVPVTADLTELDRLENLLAKR